MNPGDWEVDQIGPADPNGKQLVHLEGKNKATLSVKVKIPPELNQELVKLALKELE